MDTDTTEKRDAVFHVLSVAAVGLSIFQIWQIFTATLGANVFRPVHLGWILVLVFFKYPLVSGKSKHTRVLRLADIACAILNVASVAVILSFDPNDFSYLMDGLQPVYLVAGIVFFLLVLEATRRTVGSVMVILGAVFVGYNFLGRYLPGRIAVKSFTFSEFFSTQIYSTNGVFGLPLGIAAGVVFVFVLFGALLEMTKAGDFFTNVSIALTGRFKGGPAKASVMSSAMLGSISGSAIANAVTTGTFTIPLMKQIGYRGEQAAGVEAAASTGGQIMPPIMGAGAFIMAQYTGIPYSTIVLICMAPAILYFASVLLYVHIMAHKMKLQTSEVISGREILAILKNGGHSFISILIILVLLVMGFTPALVGLIGCGAVVLVSLLRRGTRINFSRLFLGLRKGATLAIPVSVACATAGIIVGVVGQTGLGLQITNFIFSLSQGHLFTVFLLTALMALILGMGLPVTASYILLSIVAVPVLTNFGVNLIAAHIVVFWLSQTSNVTPPIALAAFAASGVAKSNPMKSAIQAFKLSNGLLLIPVMMLYTSLLYVEGVNPLQYILSIVLTSFVIVGIAAAVEGYLFGQVRVIIRVIALIAAGTVIFTQGVVQYTALAVLIAIVVGNRLLSRSSQGYSHAGNP